jgi:hypothetical protein
MEDYPYFYTGIIPIVGAKPSEPSFLIFGGINSEGKCTSDIFIQNKDEDVNVVGNILDSNDI